MKAENSGKISEAKQDKKNKKTIVTITVFILLCASLYIYIYVIPGISGALTRTAIISYGNLKVSDETTGFLVRNEVVLSANQSGSISYYVEEGLKTRKGTKVLDIYPSSGTPAGYACPSTGVVSYYIDGYEAYFTPENISNLEFSKLQEMDISLENTSRSKTGRTEPLYKLILDDVWYIVVLVSENNVDKYTLDSKVTIEFGDGNVDGYTTALIQKSAGWLAIVKTDKYYKNFAKIRQASITVITEDYQGLIVPNTAITEENGQPGVYVKDLAGDYHFTRIKAITTDGNYSLVHSAYFYETDSQGAQIKIYTVEIYDEILRNTGLEE
jgi:putative membrane fusion protein